MLLESMTRSPMRINIYFLLLVLLSPLFTPAQKNPLQTADSTAQREWVDATYQKLTLEEKIGQLFMVLVASDQDKASTDKIKTLIEEEHLGGVIFSTGGPVRQARLNKEDQGLA